MKKVSRPLRSAAVLVLILAASLTALALVQETAPSDLLKTAEEMVQRVSRLRGLEPKSAIQMGVKSRDEIAKFLNERVKEEIDPEELRSEGKVLHILGLIPPTLDYRDFTLKLLTEQVGGYYDPEKKTYFIASWLPVDEQKPVMVHELTHALEDQHFDLGKILKEDRKLHNDDRVLAHQALFEGDGMAVMLNYLLEPAGRDFSSLPDLTFVMRQYSSMESQFPIFKSAPDFLKETLLFPYGNGASFLQKVWAKSRSWEAVNKIYSDLPVSTEQILHPEKYFDTPRDDPKPVEFEDPSVRLGKDWKTSYKNVFGEFSLDLLLRLQLSEDQSRRAAAGWGGDQVLLLENAAGKSAVFIATVWDTADDVEEFYQAMSDWLQRKYPKARKPSESPNGFSLIQGGEYSSIQRDGLKVQVFVGLPEADSAVLK